MGMTPVFTFFDRPRLACQAAGYPKILLAPVPPYSPELNPAAQVWNYMKNVLLGNICCKTVKELKNKVIEAFETIKKTEN